MGELQHFEYEDSADDAPKFPEDDEVISWWYHHAQLQLPDAGLQIDILRVYDAEVDYEVDLNNKDKETYRIVKYEMFEVFYRKEENNLYIEVAQ